MYVCELLVGGGEAVVSAIVSTGAGISVILTIVSHHSVSEPGRVCSVRNVLLQPDWTHVHVPGPVTGHR